MNGLASVYNPCEYKIIGIQPLYSIDQDKLLQLIKEAICL